MFFSKLNSFIINKGTRKVAKKNLAKTCLLFLKSSVSNSEKLISFSSFMKKSFDKASLPLAQKRLLHKRNAVVIIPLSKSKQMLKSISSFVRSAQKASFSQVFFKEIISSQSNQGSVFIKKITSLKSIEKAR
uniref:Ribosomal protein S7 n=2 Tax=Thraustochytriidae TaxID=33674 RepID=A0A481XH53_9STRA|nr:ribosomal protein S7 [Schizochytrium sp. TIO1101]QBK37902.1 ribosomal protein S7 [Aurantiochytrium acetophilum]